MTRRRPFDAYELGTTIVTDKGIIIPIEYISSYYEGSPSSMNAKWYQYQNVSGKIYPEYTRLDMCYTHISGSSYDILLGLDSILVNNSPYIIPKDGYLTYKIDALINAGEIYKHKGNNVDLRRFVQSGTEIKGGDIQYRHKYDINSNTSMEKLISSYIRSYYLYEPLDYTPNTHTAAIGGISSRAGTIRDRYAYIDGDGNIAVSGENNIINEETNSYYNPITDNSKAITDWSYDYSTRTYETTTIDGETVKVNYGNENITITEGDTVYHVYYIVTNDSSVANPDPSEPTPTPTPGEPGEPAPTPAPDTDDNKSGLAWLLDTLKAYAGGIGEKITSTTDTVINLFKSVPELFGGFMDFLRDSFAFLPPEMVDMLTLGISVMVIVGVTRLIIGR